MRGKPPSEPKPFKRSDRPYFYAQYWEDQLDEKGEVVARKQVQREINDPQGKRITTPRAAEKACRKLHEQLQAGWRNEVTDTALQEYLAIFLKTHSGRQGTKRSYNTKLTNFLNWLAESYSVNRFSQVKREYIKEYLEHRQDEVELVTVYGDRRTICAFFSEAIRDKKLAENPSRGIKLPPLGKQKASEGFFLPAELDSIVNHCRVKDRKWFPIFAGFRYAPFRREELCFLEWSDLDLEKDLIYIREEKPDYGWFPKRGGRTMDLSPRLKEVILKLRRKGPFVFPTPGAWPADGIVAERRELGRRAWRKIKVICRTLELRKKDPTGSWDRRFPKGPHLKAFRSGVCVELQLKGAPLSYCQEQLGHHSQDITLQHYTHMCPELLGQLTKKFIGVLGDGAAVL